MTEADWKQVEELNKTPLSRLALRAMAGIANAVEGNLHIVQLVLGLVALAQQEELEPDLTETNLYELQEPLISCPWNPQWYKMLTQDVGGDVMEADWMDALQALTKALEDGKRDFNEAVRTAEERILEIAHYALTNNQYAERL